MKGANLQANSTVIYKVKIINWTFLLTHRGSAAANTISQYSLAVLLFVYIRWKGLHKITWNGEYLSTYLSIYLVGNTEAMTRRLHCSYIVVYTHLGGSV